MLEFEGFWRSHGDGCESKFSKLASASRTWLVRKLATALAIKSLISSQVSKIQQGNSGESPNFLETSLMG